MTGRIVFLLADDSIAVLPHDGPATIDAAFGRYRQAGLSQADLVRVDIYGAPVPTSPEAAKRHGLLFTNIYQKDAKFDRWAIDLTVNDAIAKDLAAQA